MSSKHRLVNFALALLLCLIGEMRQADVLGKAQRERKHDHCGRWRQPDGAGVQCVLWPDEHKANLAVPEPIHHLPQRGGLHPPLILHPFASRLIRSFSWRFLWPGAEGAIMHWSGASSRLTARRCRRLAAGDYAATEPKQIDRIHKVAPTPITPARYADPKQSDLHFTIAPGVNRVDPRLQMKKG